MRLAILFAFVSLCSAAEWGQPVNGLRLSLAKEGETLILTFENVQDREMYLPLGGAVGVGEADRVTLSLRLPEGASRPLQYTGGSGVAPGRILPFIVPMLPGSIYTVRTQLRNWRVGPELNRIEADLAKGASLQAGLTAAPDLGMRYVECYGLQIFWSGSVVSNLVR